MLGVFYDVVVHLFQDPRKILVLHGGYVVLPAGDDHVHAVDDDLPGGYRDRHQTRRALPVDGLRRHRNRQARGQRREATDVHTRCSGRQHRADDDVVDLFRGNAGALYRVADRMPGHGRRLDVVEATPEGEPDGGARGRYNNCVFHAGECP